MAHGARLHDGLLIGGKWEPKKCSLIREAREGVLGAHRKLL
jgi:hypothetical protein